MSLESKLLRKRYFAAALFALSIGLPAALSGCGPAVGPDEQGASFQPGTTPGFATVSRSILAPKCVRCHSDGSPAAGLSFSSYQSTMSSGAVVASDPGASSLYNAVKSGAMPKGGPALSGSQVASIEAWIRAGAPEADPVPAGY